MAQIVRVNTACIPKTSYGAVRQEKEIILCHIKLDQCRRKYFFHQVICSMIRLMSIFSADKMVENMDI